MIVSSAPSYTMGKKQNHDMLRIYRKIQLHKPEQAATKTLGEMYRALMRIERRTP